MTPQIAEGAFQNPYVALLVGTAVSLDVIALTFCSSHIYLADKSVWRRWAKYNAGWHGGLLLCYLVLIDVAAVGTQYLGVLLNLELPDWLSWLSPAWRWIADKFRSHIVVYASLIAMAYVWYQYSLKVCSVPTEPTPDQAPFFLRRFFGSKAGYLSDPNSKWFWHLSACLVAVDMLALAAVVKSGEKLVQFPQGFDRTSGSLQELNESIASSFDTTFLIATLTITLAVFCVVGLLCFLAARVSQTFWINLVANESEDNQVLTAKLIVIALKLLEPLIIFYFIIHAMAFLATGVPLHSPAFILGSGFLVAALIQFVGFRRILDASAQQVALNVSRAQEKPDV